MEHTFANEASTRVFTGPGATTSPFALALAAATQPTASHLAPPSLRVTPTHLAATVPTSLQQALRGAAGVQYLSSPDPPTAVASAPMATRASLTAAALSSRPRHALSVPLAAARSQRRRTTRRTAPPAAAAAAAAVSSVLESPELAPAPTRRSTRTSRKRTPTAASAAADDVKDPPTKKRRGNLKKPPPGSAKKDDTEDDKPAAEEEEEKTASCCICMDEPKPADLASINGCDHLFCFECIEKWAERENTCPLCKVRFTKIDRVNKARRKGAPKNTKRVKQKDQRSDVAPGAALEGLLASFASSANFPPHRVARLIFSGMGGNPFMLPGTAAIRTRAASAADRASSLEDSLFSSDTDDDDDSSFLPAGGSSFHDLFRQLGGPFGAARGPGIVVGSAPHGIHMGSRAVYEPARSYASNGSDRTAGRPTNPLEIDDDSDEEEIEVVQVTRPL